jgi:hypothetical protein
MNVYSAVYLIAALLGALLGGAISFSVSARSARRERRARYGESLLRALTAAERRIAALLGPDDDVVMAEPLLLREEAVAAWAQTELASTLESSAGRRAMQAWGEQLYDSLSNGAHNRAQLEWLVTRLDLAVYLTIAWTAGYATGRDFSRPGTEIAAMFGPTPRAGDMPDYGRRPD